MKDNELDLDILENADDADIKRIADNCPASESDRERMFAMSRKIYNERTKESNIDTTVEVSGVEIYKKPMWQRVVSAAAVIAIAAGGIAGGWAVRNRIRKPDSQLAGLENEAAAPFGDITGDRVCVSTVEYAPQVYEVDAQTVDRFASLFNSENWEELDPSGRPDGESIMMFVYNGGDPYKLEFLMHDHSVMYESSSGKKRYKGGKNVDTVMEELKNYRGSEKTAVEVDFGDKDIIHNIWNYFSSQHVETTTAADLTYYTVYNPVLKESQQFTDFTWSINCKKDDFSYESLGYGLLDSVTALINKAEWKETGVKADMFDDRCINIGLCRYSNDMHKTNIISNLNFDISERGNVSVMYYGNEDFCDDYKTEEDAYRYFVIDENSKKEIKALIDRYVAEYNEIMEYSSVDKFIGHFGCDSIDINIHQAIVTLHTATLTDSEKESFLNALSSAELEDITDSSPLPGNNGYNNESFDLTALSKEGYPRHYHILFHRNDEIICTNGYETRIYKVPHELWEFADKLREKYKADAVGYADVPNVAGMQFRLAKQQLEDRGFTVKISEANDNTIKPDYVIRSQPEAGISVPTGSEITLYVSSGSASDKGFTLEDYVGMTVDDAAVKAGFYKLKVKTEMITDTEEKDIVVAQLPEAGETVNKGDEITLYYSNGGTVHFMELPLPDDVNGRYQLDGVIAKTDGSTKIYDFGVFLCPETTRIPIDLNIDDTQNMSSLSLYLMNTNNNKRALAYKLEFIYDTNGQIKDTKCEDINIKEVFKEVQ